MNRGLSTARLMYTSFGMKIFRLCCVHSNSKRFRLIFIYHGAIVSVITVLEAISYIQTTVVTTVINATGVFTALKKVAQCCRFIHTKCSGTKQIERTGNAPIKESCR